MYNINCKCKAAATDSQQVERTGRHGPAAVVALWGAPGLRRQLSSREHTCPDSGGCLQQN